MTGRFFRRELGWAEMSAASGLVPPMMDGHAVAPPEAQFNIAPGQHAPVIRLSRPGLYLGDYAPSGAPIIQPARWGLVPGWWTRPLSEMKFSTFNARADTLQESRTYAGAFQHGRCLVPASGVYAWSGPKGAATPFAIALRSRAWFCMAGLWTRVMIEGSELDTFAVITTAPNDVFAGLSTSMPAILREEDHARWLDPAARAPAALLRSWPAADTHAWPAHPSVGNVRNQGPHLPGDPG